MLRSKSKKAVMTKSQLLDSVAKRLAKVNPRMDCDEVRLRAKLAVKHVRKIQDLPTYN